MLPDRPTLKLQSVSLFLMRSFFLQDDLAVPHWFGGRELVDDWDQEDHAGLNDSNSLLVPI